MIVRVVLVKGIAFVVKARALLIDPHLQAVFSTLDDQLGLNAVSASWRVAKSSLLHHCPASQDSSVFDRGMDSLLTAVAFGVVAARAGVVPPNSAPHRDLIRDTRAILVDMNADRSIANKPSQNTLTRR
jgi:hypothetical protein